jgi:hypothetical protein
MVDAYTKSIRYSNEVESLLKQFSKYGTKNENYRRGHIFNFELTQEQRDIINWLMETESMSFNDAFDAYMRHREG